MNNKKLLEGYRYILESIYKEKPYYQRVRGSLKNYRKIKTGKGQLDFTQVNAFFRSMFVLGFLKKGRWEYWKLLFWALFKKPQHFIEAATMAVYGYHFRTVYGIRRM